MPDIPLVTRNLQLCSNPLGRRIIRKLLVTASQRWSTRCPALTRRARQDIRRAVKTATATTRYITVLAARGHEPLSGTFDRRLCVGSHTCGDQH